MANEKKTIKYQPEQSTEKGADAIIKILNKHPICLVNVGTGGGKTFMAIRAFAKKVPNAHLVILTTAKQRDDRDWPKSIDSYNQETINSQLTYQVTTFASLKSKKQQPKFAAELKKHRKQTIFLIVDEAHQIKDPTSLNFKYVQKFMKQSYFKRCLCLTATPFSNSLIDMQSYLILAGYYKNKTQFQKQHVKYLDQYFAPVVKHQNGKIDNDYYFNDPESIIKKFKTIQVYFDTKNLKPETKAKEITFQYNKKLQKEYNQIQKNYIDGIYESKAEAIAEQRNFIANHANQRNQFLSKIINNPNRKKDPVLIFYQYNSELDTLKNYLKTSHSDYEIKEINGHTKLSDRKTNATQTPKPNTIFLCQYTSASEAFNASWSHCSIFYTPTYSWEKFKQAQGRNVRAYQKGTVYQFRFVVLKTINAHYWYDLIDQKRKFTNQVMDQFLTNPDF